MTPRRVVVLPAAALVMLTHQLARPRSTTTKWARANNARAHFPSSSIDASAARSKQRYHHRTKRPHNPQRTQRQRNPDLPHVTCPRSSQTAAPRRRAPAPPHPSVHHRPSYDSKPARRPASPAGARVWHPCRPPPDHPGRARLSPRRPNGPTSNQRATAPIHEPPPAAAPAAPRSPGRCPPAVRCRPRALPAIDGAPPPPRARSRRDQSPHHS